jgi:hypothetical protein
MSGFDKYLEFQFDWSGDFYKFLFRAISQADEFNLARLAAGFPEEVEAYITWTRVGSEAFLAKCSPSHPLVKRVLAGTAVL